MYCVCTISCLFDIQIGRCLAVSKGFRRQGLTCGSLKVRVCCFPRKPPVTDRHIFPPEPCWSEHTTEHLFTNSPDGALLTPERAPHHLIPRLGPDGGPHCCSLLSASRTNHEVEWPAGTAPGRPVPLTADHPQVASNVPSCQKTNCPTDCSFMNSPCGPFLKRG